MNSNDSLKNCDFTVRADVGRRDFLRYTLGTFTVIYTGAMASGCGGGDGDGDAQVDDRVLVGTLIPSSVSKEPVVFVHVSDSHFDSEFDSEYDKDDYKPILSSGVDQSKTGPELMRNLLANFIPVIKPNAAIHTGDITEKGYIPQAWQTYKNIVDSSPFSSGTKYVDIIGNHDVKVEALAKYTSYERGLNHFIEYSRSKTRYGYTTLSSSAGTVRLIRTNTSASMLEDSGRRNLENIYGYFPATQQQNLYQHPDRNEDVALNVVLGHSPVITPKKYTPLPKGYTRGDKIFEPGTQNLDSRYTFQITEGNDLMIELIDEFNAKIYLCGHVHVAGLTWVGKNKTLVVTAPTFGHYGFASFFYLVAYDLETKTSSAKLVKIEANTPPKWPIVFITAPANQLLGNTNNLIGNVNTGTEHSEFDEDYILGNPNAEPFAKTATPKLRAMIFYPATNPVSQVQYRLGGKWFVLELKTARLWEDTLSLQGLNAGTYNVEVRATLRDGSTGSDTISIEVV